MTLVFLLKEVLKWLVLASHGLLLVLVAGHVSVLKRLPGLRQLEGLLHRHSLRAAFIVALVASLGSLFYSEIVLFEPCKLCWYQRVFMYPLAIILGMAWWREERGLVRYALPLAVLGGLVAAYQYVLQLMTIYGSGVAAACSATGPSCVVPEFVAFGYITIPLMSFTAFAFIVLGLLAAKKLA